MKQITVEKRLPIFSAETLVELSRLGVRIGDGSGRIHVTLEIPPEAEKEILRIVRRENFLKANIES
jgi:hypothetical protein